MPMFQSLRFALRTAKLGDVGRGSPRRVERLARWRLNRLVKHAIRHSPFYREKYRGISSGEFTLADLPPVSKAELAANLQDTLTDPRLRVDDISLFLADASNVGRWFRGRYAVSHTSGSQGVPLVIVQDRRALETLFCLMSARSNVAKPSVIEGYRRLRHPARVAVVAQHRGFYPSAAAFEFMKEFTQRFATVRRFSALDPHLAEELNEFQPNTLVGYASVLESLALDSELYQLNELKQIANSSEQLSDRARRRIETAFRVPVVDHYGVGECLLLSDGCPTDGGAHINADWVIVENVDDQYRPVPAGETGSRVLVTNLANHVQPFIRYEVPDRIVMATGPCRCGSRLPRIERIEGRSAEAFWVQNSNGQFQLLPGVLFHSAMDELRGVREWRAVQTERNVIELQLELFGGEEWTFDEPGLVARLQEFGLPTPVRVTVEQVIGLRPDRHTGKYRRLISEVGPPEERLKALCA